MTNQQHPITPPPELFKRWEDDILNERDNVDHVLNCAWRNGFQAGADQELEACCEFLDDNELCDPNFHKDLRAARRPKPPSLKEQALKMLDDVERFTEGDFYIIRQALEQLDD